MQPKCYLFQWKLSLAISLWKSKMALEDWKDVVGNAATICTIVQFLVGAQVKIPLSRFLFDSLISFPHRFAWGIIVPSPLERAPLWHSWYIIFNFDLNFFLQTMTFTQVGVVMTFVWMNYGRMVEDSTLQTVNTTGLILQVEIISSKPWTKLRMVGNFASFPQFRLSRFDLSQTWLIFAEHLCFRLLLHHFTQAASWEEDFPHDPPPLCHWHVHHHCRGLMSHNGQYENYVHTGFERNNSQHWMAGGNHVCCLLLCPTG